MVAIKGTARHCAVNVIVSDSAQQTFNSGHFFFFFNLGPVCISSGSTSAFKAYCANLNFHQHRFIIPVSLIKKQKSLSEAVLISFGSTNGFSKIL
jgi:hypothetical protein